MYALALAFLLADDPPTFHFTKGEQPSEYLDPGIAYMLASTQDAWIKTLPQTDDPTLARLLKRPLIAYNHDVLPRVSQYYNESWNGEFNRSATNHPVGVTTLDPQWRNTAGFPEGVMVTNFIALPDKGDIHVWKAYTPPTSSHGGKTGDSGDLMYAQFPVGTSFLEAGYQRIEGHDLCFEIRTRTKATDGYGVDHWRVNRYVPCRDALEYDQAVQRASGRSSGILAFLKPNPYRKERFAFTFPRFQHTILAREGYQVALPKLEPETVSKVLTAQPFRSTLDKNWQDFEDGMTCAAPTTEHDNQLYPRGYQGGFFPTSSKNCKACHEDNAKPSFDIGEGDWYGVTQCYDSVMSWTPIRPIYSRVSEQQVVDPRIASSPRVKLHAPK